MDKEEKKELLEKLDQLEKNVEKLFDEVREVNKKLFIQYLQTSLKIVEFVKEREKENV